MEKEFMMVRMMVAAALLVSLTSASPLLAASPLLCRPYAGDVARTVQTYAWMKAYASCLSSDSTPVFIDRTNVQAAFCAVFGDCGGQADVANHEPLPSGAKLLPGSVPATGAISSNKVKTVAVKKSPAQICADAGKRLVKRAHGWRCR